MTRRSASRKNQARKECILTVDLNLQTFSSKSRNAFAKFIVMVIVAALALTGAVPSFAEKNGAASDKAVQLKASAQIDWADAPSVSGTSAIMIDAGSGEILYEKNAYEQRDPASITKILTCLVVLETMELDQEITVSKDADDTGHNMASKAGEVFTVEQLLYAMMVYSANDAAEILALAAGGSMENFCQLMNERAVRCGAENTNFTNANGLNTYGQENHKTTAYDIAMISKEAMKNQMFRKLVSTVKYTIPATDLSEKRVFRSTNACLYIENETLEIDGQERPFKYKGANGIKTGYTSVAGRCFCGSAKRGSTELIAVVLNSPEDEDRFADVIKLWDYGFSKYSTYVAAKSKEAVDEVRVKRGDKSKVAISVSEDLDITFNKGYDRDAITTEIALNEDITAPVAKGDELGTITVRNEDGDAVAQVPLLAMEKVEKGGPLSYIGIADEDIPFFLIGTISIIVILILIRIIFVRMKRKKKQRRRAQRQRKIKRKEREKEKNPFE
ncbi:MAG: D-alanyl-D-alanine carboxypeptidase family protein [Bacillota bacterium]|nr:D-alanyl-D-alanine carboxypeptidase family protein [Bacillota bacterium]